MIDVFFLKLNQYLTTLFLFCPVNSHKLWLIIFETKAKTFFQIYPPLKGRLAPQLKPTTETASTTTNFIMITAGTVMSVTSWSFSLDGS